MKILSQHIARMYVLTIILFIAFVAASSYGLGLVPYALIVAVACASLVEAAIMVLYLKQKAKIPFSAIITGFIIGAVAPINAPILLVIIASVIAILSKYFVRAKGTNIFNPATLGLLLSLAIFGMGDQWWAASSYNVYGLLISFTPLFIISAYEARRAISGLSFVVVTLVIGLILSKSGNIGSVGYLLTALFSVNYLFAFVMVADPKTSPHKNRLQFAFGASIAIISALLAVYGIPYPLLISLLIGNLAYAAYRSRGAGR